MAVCTLLDLFGSESNSLDSSWSGNDVAYLQPESSSHLQIMAEAMIYLQKSESCSALKQNDKLLLSAIVVLLQ